MGALSSLEGEVTRLARAVESFAAATPTVRRMLADVDAVHTAPPAPAERVQAALDRLDARLARLAVQSEEAGSALRDVLASAVEESRAESRRAGEQDGRP